MKTFDQVVIDDLTVSSYMMDHEGGTKFYEVIYLETSRISETVCLTRWGKVGSKESGGTLGKAKILNGKYGSRYCGRIIENKESRGYRKSANNTYEGHNALRVLGNYNLHSFLAENNESTSEARIFFRELGVDDFLVTEPVIEEKPYFEEMEEDIPPPPVKVRHESFGSW